MTYFKTETGAVTIDWVVLTAALVGLGMATMSVVSTGTQDASKDIEIETSVSQSGSNIGASGWADGVHQVRITMDDPGEEVRMGFGVITNQPISDETIGIDNFSITTAGLGY